MPATAPFPNAQPLYPALYLYPLNDSFVPKHISLSNGVRIKIGRQTNPKTVPGERNGYFDSKVLSRQHAEVWESEGKVCLLTINLPHLSLNLALDLYKGREKLKRHIHQRLTTQCREYRV